MYENHIFELQNEELNERSSQLYTQLLQLRKERNSGEFKIYIILEILGGCVPPGSPNPEPYQNAINFYTYF